MQPQSVTDICNTALGHLGEPEIQNINQTGNEAARLCRLHYPIARDAMIRRHRWNFAVTRIPLAQSSTAPVSGYDYAYPLPSNFIRLLELNDIDAADLSGFFSVEGKSLFTDEATATIRYLSRIEDTTYFDALFTDALSYDLAARLAGPLTQSAGMQGAMAEMAREKLGEAMKADGNESRKRDPHRLTSSPLVRSRSRGAVYRPDLTIDPLA